MMSLVVPSSLRRCRRAVFPLIALGALLLSSFITAAAAETSADALLLQQQYQTLLPQLMHNQFARPLYLKSTEGASSLRSDIYAVVDYPFAQVHEALISPAHWCDILILHLNTKYCRADSDATAPSLSMRVGKKGDQNPEDAFRLDFSYRIAASASDYFDVRLNADKGPFDTRDYRIRLEAVPIGDGRSVIHLMYSYSYGTVSRLALRAYLATVAGNKVGFTPEQNDGGAKSDYVGGMRGTIERNTMRYYLAIDAYLSALAAPPAQQLDQRLETWFNATERYPRQLHEIDKAAYLKMKRKETARQNAVAPLGNVQK